VLGASDAPVCTNSCFGRNTVSGMVPALADVSACGLYWSNSTYTSLRRVVPREHEQRLSSVARLTVSRLDRLRLCGYIRFPRRALCLHGQMMGNGDPFGCRSWLDHRARVTFSASRRKARGLGGFRGEIMFLGCRHIPNQRDPNIYGSEQGKMRVLAWMLAAFPAMVRSHFGAQAYRADCTMESCSSCVLVA
jgi:hypothetical protein